MKTGTPIGWNTDAPNEDLKTFRAKSRTERKKNLLAFPQRFHSPATHTLQRTATDPTLQEKTEQCQSGKPPARPPGGVQSQQAEDSTARAGPGTSTHLCQLLGFVVEGIHYFTHVLNCFQSSFIRFIYWGFIENNQDTLPLVQDPCRKHKRTQVKARIRHTSTGDAARSLAASLFSRKEGQQKSPSCSICACLLYALITGMRGTRVQGHHQGKQRSIVVQRQQEHDASSPLHHLHQPPHPYGSYSP